MLNMQETGISKIRKAGLKKINTFSRSKKVTL
jgi:hypothetical protein